MDVNGPEASVTDSNATPPRPSTTLFSLSDDIITSIFEELHEQRCEEVDALRVSEILINKRIFAVACPFWFSRLKISEDQLDGRLTGLLEHEDRRRCLRQLDLRLVPVHVLLTKHVVSGLSRLSHLCVTFRNDATGLVLDTFVDIVTSLSTLRHVMTHSYDYSFEIFERAQPRLLSARHRSVCSWTVYKGSRLIYIDRFDNGKLVNTHLSELADVEYREVPWVKIKSCRCGPVTPKPPPPVGAWLQGLAAALRKDENRSTPSIPLRDLALDLHSNMGWAQNDGTSAQLETLFRLLAYAHVERLEFTSATSLPRVQDTRQYPSVRVLTISGNCSLKDELEFMALSRLLTMSPSLAQLHLIGDRFFRSLGTNADEISKLGTIDQCVLRPELYALLFILGRTKVKIFTYRGKTEKRELRWTRFDEKDEFERDCWTL